MKEIHISMEEVKIIMQEGASLVWRDAFYLDSLNINDLPRPT